MEPAFIFSGFGVGGQVVHLAIAHETLRGNKRAGANGRRVISHSAYRRQVPAHCPGTSRW